MVLINVSSSPDISPGLWMMAKYRRSWAPGWTESHSRSYGSKEAQAQGRLDEPGPE
ncbi:MAG: hypothetical protein GWN29_05895 [Gammaproteobacteria bacterium]|nr:hypothetical protein [Gammaproteobacteria bacterium]